MFQDEDSILMKRLLTPQMIYHATADHEVWVSLFSENGATYFYHPEEAVSSQLSTGGRGRRLRAAAVVVRLSGMKVRYSAPNFVQEK